MKRILSLFLILTTLFLFSCRKADETSEPDIYVSDPIAEISYTVAFRKEDAKLAAEFDRILGEVIEDGTASRLCEVHMGADYVSKDPIPSNVGKADDDSLKRVREAGKIVIGYHKQHQPMIWIDASDKAVGFDAELAYEIGRRMGLTVEFKILEWQRADTSLESGAVDAVLSAYEYTTERAERFNLTRTYLDTSLVLISKATEPYDSISELTEKKVCVCQGTYAESLLADSGAEVLTFSSNVNAYEKIKNKSCVALLANKAFASYLEKELATK